MSIRVVLRSPSGDQVVRDVVDGRWQEPSGDVDTIIGEGLWALPGLADAHAHLAAEELNYRPGVFVDAMERAIASLSAGVTLILDKGWSDDVTIRVLEALDPDRRPEIEAAARILAAKHGYYPHFAHEIDLSDIRQAVAEEAEAGAGWVKLVGDWPRRGMGPVANFNESQLRQAVQVAESKGSKVAIHTMAREVPSMAVAAGVHSIEHGLFLTEADIEALGERGGMWVPTLLRNEATLARLGSESSGGMLFVEGLEQIRGLLPLAIESGVHVLAGTDLVGSPVDVAAEARRLGEYGLSNVQVVAAVSTAAFIATGRDPLFNEGTPADAVLFPANPVDDLGVLTHPSRVIRQGRIL